MLINNDNFIESVIIFFIRIFYFGLFIIFMHRVRLFIIKACKFNFAYFLKGAIIIQYMIIFNLISIGGPDNLNLIFYELGYFIELYIDCLRVIGLFIRVCFFIINIFYGIFILLSDHYFYFWIRLLVQFFSKFCFTWFNFIFWRRQRVIDYIFFTCFIIFNDQLIFSIIILIDIIFVVEFAWLDDQYYFLNYLNFVYYHDLEEYVVIDLTDIIYVEKLYFKVF